MIDLQNFLSGVISGFCLAVLIPFPRGGEEGSYWGPTELFDAWVERSFAANRLFLRLRYAVIVAVSLAAGALFVVLGRW
ncbi:MAG: hypothetical protein ACOYYS_10200 [Chloroflexota bacterium]